LFTNGFNAECFNFTACEDNDSSSVFSGETAAITSAADSTAFSNSSSVDASIAAGTIITLNANTSDTSKAAFELKR
jgi:hypothetical protein